MPQFLLDRVSTQVQDKVNDRYEILEDVTQHAAIRNSDKPLKERSLDRRNGPSILPYLIRILHERDALSLQALLSELILPFPRTPGSKSKASPLSNIIQDGTIVSARFISIVAGSV